MKSLGPWKKNKSISSSPSHQAFQELDTFGLFNPLAVLFFILFQAFQPLLTFIKASTFASHKVQTNQFKMENSAEFLKRPVVRTYQKLGIIFENQFSQA